MYNYKGLHVAREDLKNATKFSLPEFMSSSVEALFDKL